MKLIDSKLEKKYLSNNLSYDCVVIGTGTSSEPVIFHLSKSNLKTLVIDRSDINKEYNNIGQIKNKFVRNISPKQIFSNLKVHFKNKIIDLSENTRLKCYNFAYVYSSVSGGLSNFWGGGLFNWPESEIKKTTSLPYKLINESYKNISKRLQILNRDQFLKKSSFATLFFEKHKGIAPNIFRSSKFFISKEGLKNHQKKRDYFDQHLIWKSSQTIKKYINESDNIKYSANTTALSIKKDTPNNNIIYCKINDELVVVKTKAIFLCSGVINSTHLVFSALNKKKASFMLNHSFAAIVPILYLGFLPRFNKENIDLPDISWSLLSNDENISGYLLSSHFLKKKLIKISKITFLKIISKILDKFLSSFAFITVFTNSTNTKTFLKIKRKFNSNYQYDDFLLEIINHNSAIDSKMYISRKLNKLSPFIKGKFFLIKFLTKYVKIGADIHYGSTMPDENIITDIVNTSSIGEIKKAKNIYVCDSSRMAYISSLPHTFTSMAIVDASMPKIIKKLIKNLN